MGAFGGLILTNQGRALQAKVQTGGATLKYTSVKIGDGQLAGQSIPTLTKLISAKLMLPIIKLEIRPDSKAVVGTVLSNKDVTSGFYFREIGVFAQDPDFGEILYSYGNAGVNAEYIPPGGGPDVIEKYIDIITLTGNAANVTAEIDESLIFVTQREFNETIGPLQDNVAAHASELSDHESRIADIETDREQANIQTATLQRGLNVLNTDRVSGTKFKDLDGQTQINQLGNGARSRIGWGTLINNGTGMAEITSNGTIKITADGANWINAYKPTSLKSNTHYLLVLDIKDNTTTGDVVFIRGTEYGMATLQYDAQTPPGYVGKVAKTFITGTIVDNTLNMYVGPGTAAGSYIEIGDMGIFELTEAEYNAINAGDNSLVDAYQNNVVSGMQSLTNPYVIAKGKNLVPPFTRGWTLHANAKAEEPYKLVLNATAQYQGSGVRIDALPNTQYSISFSRNGRVRVGEYRDHAALEWRHYDNADESGHVSLTFTTTSETNTIFMDFGSIATSGIFTLENPMLNLGSEPLSFEPYDEQYAYVQETIREGERLYDDNGRLMKWTTKGYKVLDGSLSGWGVTSSATGYKNIQIPQESLINSVIVKYDGKPLEYVTARTATDQYNFINGYLVMTISSADSGWGDSYTPTSDEIKAYFNGWKMFNADVGVSTPYDGTGTKRWVKIYDDGSGWQATVPTTSYDEWTPYQLQYDLATPYAQEVDVIGDVSLEQGANTLEYGEGLYVEQVTPAYDPVDKNYKISGGNVASMSHAPTLSHDNDRILIVLKDGLTDGSWKITRRTARSTQAGFGMEQAASTEYNPNAVYHVVYIALDKYKLTTNAETVQVEYNASQKSVIDQAVRDIADHKTQLDWLRNNAALKGTHSDPINVPTLNGWKLANNGSLPLRYYFDEQTNMVFIEGFLNGGTMSSGTVVGQIPKVLAPSTTLPFICESRDGSNNKKIGTFDVRPDGNLAVNDVLNDWLLVRAIYKL